MLDGNNIHTPLCHLYLSQLHLLSSEEEEPKPTPRKEGIARRFFEKKKKSQGKKHTPPVSSGLSAPGHHAE
jgi:hypothetical protein